MPKKTNCKHGLDRKQEIEARRIRVRLEEGELYTISRYNALWRLWFRAPSMSFEDFLLGKDKVCYSAYVRACDNVGKHTIYTRIATYVD